MFSNGIGFNFLGNPNSGGGSNTRPVKIIDQSMLDPNTGRYLIEPEDNKYLLLVNEADCPIQLTGYPLLDYDELQIQTVVYFTEVFIGDNTSVIQSGNRYNAGESFKIFPTVKAILKTYLINESKKYLLTFEPTNTSREAEMIYSIQTGNPLNVSEKYSTLGYTPDIYVLNRKIFIVNLGIDSIGLLAFTNSRFNPITGNGFQIIEDPADGIVVIEYYLNNELQDLNTYSIVFTTYIKRWT